MKDPFIAGVMFRIEQIIGHTDEEASSAGLTLTDSQIRSTLIKVRKLVLGGKPGIPNSSNRDQILAGLAMALFLARDDFKERTTAADGQTRETPLKTSDWVKALETVEGSIKRRQAMAPGSRNYLDFIHGFIARVREESEQEL
ncbi:MAG: hypothetical protein ABL994_24520 [Verrucomicrobiales bacterium]